MNTKRWIYLGVLGLSLLSLLVDRVFISEPSEADAAPITLPTTPSQHPVPAVRSTVAQPTVRKPGSADQLVDRLRALPSPAVIRDVFALSGDFLARSKSGAPSETEAEQQRQALAVSFPTHHKLQTTLISGAETLAVVDGQVLHVGHTVDGLNLCRVDPGRAVFCDETNTPTAVLTLDPPQQ